MSEEKKDTRTWMYRRAESGEVEAKLFNSPDDVPKGYYDHPDKVPPAKAAGGDQKPAT